MTLRVHTDTRVEALAQRLLADTVRGAAQRDPFEPERVLVPSASIARWLQAQVAGALGACVNWRFDFVGSFVWQCLRAAQPALPARAPFDARVTVWPLLDALARAADDADFAPLAAARGGDEAARFRLARSVAQAFERYLVGRAAWFDGEAGFPASTHGRWQQKLWQAALPALPGLSDEHPARRFVEAMQRAREAGERPAGMPARVAFFGVPVIAPAHLDVLGALSAVADVDLYLLDPCGAFWLDAIDAPTRQRMLAERPDLAMLYEPGVHPLLGAWGKSARDGLACVADAIDRWHGEDLRATVDDGPDEAGDPRGEGDPVTLLARLQHGIRSGEAPLAATPGSPDPGSGGAEAAGSAAARLAEPAAAEPAVAPPAVALPAVAPCASLQVHGCHGALRQAEVLHDVLLDLFETLPGLAPHEVVVLTPDLERLGPAIDAVFQAAPAPRRIPVELSGRSPLAEPCAAALLELLRLPCGRATAAALLEAVAEPHVAAMLGLPEDGPERLRGWVRAAGIRAGLDESHVAAAEVDTGGRHTMRAGLHRLLLSLALDASHDGLADLAARGDCAAGDLVTLDRLTVVVDALSELGRIARRAQPVAEWTRVLAHAVERLVDPRGGHAGVDRVRLALDALREAATTPGVQPAVTLDVALAALADELAAGSPGAVPGAAVTVAPIESMRGVPFRVVCLAGFDDAAFPRASRAPDWDLMAAAPRAGDRIGRMDDRGAFLEALLAAREAVVITYASRDARTNEPMAAALPVEELREHLRESFGAGAWVDLEHPLSPCAASLFAPHEPSREPADATDGGAAAGGAGGTASAARHGAPFASHAAERLPAARAFAVPRERRAPRAFLDEDLCARLPARLALRGGEPVVPLASLLSFLAHPVRHFVGQRLRAASAWVGEAAEEVDPVLPEARSRRVLAYAALDRWLAMPPAARDRARLVDWLARDPQLPGGAVGRAVAEAIADDACALLAAIESHGAPCVPRAFELPLRLPGDGTAVRLAGRLDRLREQAQVLRPRRPDQVDGADVLPAWCRHLVLCAVDPLAGGTVLVERHAVHCFSRPTDPVAPLAELVEAFVRMQTRPAPIAPRTAWKSLTESESEARKTWEGEGRWPGERDASYRRVWRDALPALDDAVGCTRPLLAPAASALGIAPKAAGKGSSSSAAAGAGAGAGTAAGTGRRSTSRPGAGRQASAA